MSERGRNALVGLIALAILAVAGFGLSLYLAGAFKSGFEVTGVFQRAGQLLRSGSDVKMRGVLVGQVRRVEVGEGGLATVTMRIFPDQRIPDNVGAAVRAKTLFGEKFIDLIAPERPSGSRLTEGDEIPLERTIPPLEVETILEKAVPLLNAIDPVQFGGALHALAEGLVGNEERLRRATEQGLKTLTETERTLPNFERNLVHLDRFASALDDADDDLLVALDGLERVGRELIANRGALDRTLGELTGLGRDLGDIVTARRSELAVLSGEPGEQVLRAVADEADDLPAVLSVLDGFLGVWIRDLSEGPYWRIFLDATPGGTQAAYPPGTEPRPRTSAARVAVVEELRQAVGASGSGWVAIFAAPVPDDEMPGLARRLGLDLEGLLG